MSLMVKPASQITIAIREHDGWSQPILADLRTQTASDLTARGIVVLRLLVRGHTYDQVARRTGMTRAAVEQHVRRSRESFGAETTTQLVYMATKAGLLDGPVPPLPPCRTWKQQAEAEDD